MESPEQCAIRFSFRDRVAGDDLWFVDWERVGDNPGVLKRTDLPRLLASDALFARKFDPSVDVEVLDRMADESPTA